MARRAVLRPAPPPAIASASWRDGVHLTDTPIWCDARRRRDICFVSAADRLARSGHGQLIATPVTLALLAQDRGRGGGGVVGFGGGGAGDLGVPLHRRFTLGMVQLELLPSGRGLGAAALLAHHAGRRVLYAGPIRREVPAAMVALGLEPAEVRPCDALVVAAPAHRAPPRPLATAIAATVAWVAATLAQGQRPVLVVDSSLDALEVAACLAAEGIALAGSRAVRDVARRAATFVQGPAAVSTARARRDHELRAGEAGVAGVAGVERATEWAIAAPTREPRATLWLSGDRTEPPGPSVHSHLSELGWSTSADARALLAWIDETGAREVHVTGPGAEAVVAALGSRARVLGPPRQMPLFPREATP